MGEPAAAHVVCQHSHAVLEVAPPADEGGLPILRYWLVRERALTGRGRVGSFEHPFELEVRPSDFSSDGKLIIMSNLIPRATYRVRIAAENAVGRGPWSEPVMVVAGVEDGSPSSLAAGAIDAATASAKGEISYANEKSVGEKSIRIYGAHVHFDEPCLGPIAVVCPHSQQVTIEVGVEDGCKGVAMGEIESNHGIHGHRHEHFHRSHGGEEVKVEAWLLHHSPRTHDVRGELVTLPTKHRHGCNELPLEERRRVSGRYVQERCKFGRVRCDVDAGCNLGLCLPRVLATLCCAVLCYATLCLCCAVM